MNQCSWPHINHLPRSPLTTRLSGSARETEHRIRNIFQWKKKRPPVLVLVLAAVIIALCGSLVSCQKRPSVPSIIMETQYYDNLGTYIEIPALSLPTGEQNESVDAINAALDELREEYRLSLSGTEYGSQCLFYPSTTDRYLNLVFFQKAADYGNDGYIASWVYDKKEGVQVTTEDALALAGTDRESLFADLEAVIAADPEDPRELYQTADPISLQGFRIKADGKPVFYLTAVVDCRDMGDDGFLDEWSRLYVWDNGVFTRYHCMVFVPDGPPYDRYPLVTAEETDQLDPPLWNQWYFAGEAPAGGFVDNSRPDVPHSIVLPVKDLSPYNANLYPALLSCYADYQDQWNIYYADFQSDSDQAGDLRVGPATYLGEIYPDETTTAVAYQVCYTFYTNGSRGLEWHANFEVVVLGFDTHTCNFISLLGRADFDPQGMSIEEIISWMGSSMTLPCHPPKITVCSTPPKLSAIGIWSSSGRNFTRT